MRMNKEYATPLCRSYPLPLEAVIVSSIVHANKLLTPFPYSVLESGGVTLLARHGDTAER